MADEQGEPVRRRPRNRRRRRTSAAGQGDQSGQGAQGVQGGQVAQGAQGSQGQPGAPPREAGAEPWWAKARQPDQRAQQGSPRGGQRDQGRRHRQQGAATPAEPSGPPRDVVGLLEPGAGGGGVLRPGGLASAGDARVPPQLAKSVGLRPGDLVEGVARGGTLTEVTLVNGAPPEGLGERREFAGLTAVHPETPITLGPKPHMLSGRLLDVVAPIGRGQRALIVAPPKAGKTTLLKDIAIGAGYESELYLVTCLVAERPEEVTDLRRAVPGMVLAADLDMPPESHIRVANLGVEHSKRMVESGRHVVMLLDSLTRLARAHNLALRGTSRTLSGGMDAAALQPVRQVFGAARAAEEGGSLTIIATCLVDTGSKMDDLVYEEFKGTGNMEVVLDRGLAERRLYPAVDIGRSGTRREELLLEPEMLLYVQEMRRQMAGAPADQALSALLDVLRKTS